MNNFFIIKSITMQFLKTQKLTIAAIIFAGSLQFFSCAKSKEIEQPTVDQIAQNDRVTQFIQSVETNSNIPYETLKAEFESFSSEEVLLYFQHSANKRAQEYLSLKNDPHQVKLFVQEFTAYIKKLNDYSIQEYNKPFSLFNEKMGDIIEHIYSNCPLEVIVKQLNTKSPYSSKDPSDFNQARISTFCIKAQYPNVLGVFNTGPIIPESFSEIYDNDDNTPINDCDYEVTFPQVISAVGSNNLIIAGFLNFLTARNSRVVGNKTRLSAGRGRVETVGGVASFTQNIRGRQ